jgi:predicted ThiF/HesA family dinucleotide-utilizing enzyme
MTPARTAGEYRDQLRRLLDRGRETLTVEEQQTLRTVVRARRTRRRGSETIQTSTAIDVHAATIVEVLESAARVLRPRETQELDDFVIGVERAVPDHDPYIPVRLHRRGG